MGLEYELIFNSVLNLFNFFLPYFSLSREKMMSLAAA